MSGIGDINGDGRDDFIVGAHQNDANGSNAGAAYVFASPVPSGTLRIDDSDGITNETSVTLLLGWTPADEYTDVTDMRVRNAGDTWGGWIPVASTMGWTLPTGDGTKVVEAQVRDEDGAPSVVLEDSIVLDQTPPTGSMVINLGAETTVFNQVNLDFELTDNQSGVAEIHIRNEGESWSPWTPAVESTSWYLSLGGGIKVIEAECRDAALNVSEIFSDSIEFLADLVPPEIDSIRVNADAPYVLPGEAIQLGVYARDNIGGAGEDAFKLSFDGGKTWSDWYTLDLGSKVDIDRPAAEGLVQALLVARDKVGNETDEVPFTFYLVEAALPSLGAGAQFAGRIAAAADVDATTLDLVKGDDALVQGRFPADAKKPGISGFVAPETGRYRLIVLLEKGGQATGTYKLAAKVKQAKGNKKVKGEWTGTEIAFDAVAGSTLKAKLAGEGLDAAQVTLVGPEGEVELAAKGKPGKVALAATLDAGTGTYRFVLPTALTLKGSLALKLPKIKGVVVE